MEWNSENHASSSEIVAVEQWPGLGSYRVHWSFEIASLGLSETVLEVAATQLVLALPESAEPDRGQLSMQRYYSIAWKEASSTPDPN
jgi:hypothetical protein